MYYSRTGNPMDINRIWNRKHSTILNIQLKGISDIAVDSENVRGIRADSGSAACIVPDIQISFL